MSATILIALALALAQAGPPTTNPQAKAQAQALLREGTALYDKGDYATALEKFNAAYSAYPSPKILLNVGQANRDLGRLVEALEAMERFVTEASDAAPEALAEGQRSVGELRGKLGRIIVETEPGAEVSIDGRPVGVAPLPRPVWAQPGRHQVVARHPSLGPAVADVDVVAGGTKTAFVSLQRPVAAAPEPPAEPTAAPPPSPAPLVTSTPTGTPEGRWLGRRWTWIAAGSTIVFATTAIVAGLSMQSRFEELNSTCGSKSAARPGCSESDISSVGTRRNVANVFWVFTGIAAATTGALFYAEGRTVGVVPVVSTTGVGFFGQVRL